MDINLTIEPTVDLDLIREIVTSPYVWDKASDDGIEPDEFIPVIDGFSFWLLAKTDEICGIILVNVDSSVAIKVHPYVLEKHKGKGYYMLKAFLKWYVESSTEKSIKINMKTPVFNGDGIKVALKLGFKEEGVERQSYEKDGKIYDQCLLGITKDEIRGLVKWAA